MVGRARGFRAALAAGCAFAALGAGPVLAQGGGAPGHALEEVVVTAQRRSERLVDVPMSVVALSGAQVEKAGIQSIHDIGNLTAGVQVNFAGCCTQPAIRGISTLTTGLGFENNVAVYVDGFYTPDNTTVNSDLANISSIEVLKGPQGALWGRNATGGAILINTLAPSSSFTGKLQAGYARYDEVMASAYLSGPIADRLRFSIAAYGRKGHGYNKRLGPTGQEIGWASPLRQASVRAKLEADLTPDLVGTLSFNYGHSSDARGNLFTVQQYPSATLPRPPARADRPYTGSSNREPLAQLLAITQESTLKLVYSTPVGKLTSYTGVAVRRHKQALDFDSSYSDFTYSAAFWRQSTFQQGLDFNISAIEGLDLVVGGNYYTDRYKELRGFTYASNNLVSNTTMTLKTDAIAGFVDATYHLTDALSINGGARYTEEKKSGAQRTVSPAGAIIGQPAQDSVKFKAFTPRASIRYELASDTNVYATIARGFRSGGYPPFSVASAAAYVHFKPEKITSYEVGFKMSRARYRFDVAAFLYDYKDLQVGVTIPNPLIPSTTVQTVLNAPKAEVYGIDADLMAQPVDRLNVHVGVAWLHGRYTRFPLATGTGLNIATMTNITNQSQNWTGQQMTRAPTLSGNLGVDYTFEDVAGGSLLVGGNLKYTDSYVIHAASLYGPAAGPALANKQRYRQGAYTLVNLQMTWTDPSERYRVMLYLNNVTDKRYKITYNGGAFGDYSSWGQPRTWGVKVGYDF